jgi:hypothetical protein
VEQKTKKARIYSISGKKTVPSEVVGTLENFFWKARASKQTNRQTDACWKEHLKAITEPQEILQFKLTLHWAFMAANFGAQLKKEVWKTRHALWHRLGARIELWYSPTHRLGIKEIAG